MYGSNSSNPLLLDTFNNSVIAYSLRKLSNTYNGYCVKVRRSSDNTTQNVGFNSDGIIDISSLLSFVGTGNGYVDTLYDQSGNGNNITQSILASQPQIVNAGSLYTCGNHYSIYCNTGAYMTRPCLNFTDYSGYFVFKLQVQSGCPILFQNGTGNGVGLGLLTLNAHSAHERGVADHAFGSWDNAYDFNTVIRKQSANKLNCSQRGNNYTLTPSTVRTPSGIFWLFCLDGGASQFFGGYFQEMIFFSDDKSSDTSRIKTNINTYYSVY